MVVQMRCKLDANEMQILASMKSCLEMFIFDLQINQNLF